MTRWSGINMKVKLMKKEKHIIIAILFVLSVALCPFSAAAEEVKINLQQAKELAQKYSITIQQHQLNLDKADKAKRDADDNYSKIVANYFTEAQETMVVNAREAYRAALNAYSDSKTLYENIKTALDYDVEALYLTILNAENELKLMEYDLRTQADLVKLERLKLELGMSTDSKVRQVELALDSLHSAHNSANIQLQNYKATMNRLMGREPNTPLILDPVVELNFNKEIGSLEETYKKVTDNYLALKQYERIISEKEKDKDWYGYNQSDKIENLNNTIKEAKIARDNTEKALKQSVIAIYDKISMFQRNITNTQSNLEVARRNYEFDQQKYKLGMISPLELKTSEKALEVARKNYSKAEYDYFLSLRELELAEKGIILASNQR